jgi:hypothetical protein
MNQGPAGSSRAFCVLKRLETDIFPAFGAKPISEVTASASRQSVQKVEQGGAAEIAKRVLQNCADAHPGGSMVNPPYAPKLWSSPSGSPSRG